MTMNFRRDEDELKPLSIFSQSSLTDIVLLLLIFFLLTSSFVTNFGIKVNIPKAETGAQTNQDFIPVTVTRKGDFFVAGEPASRGTIAQAIREAYNENPGATMLLRADKEALVDDAVRVMNIGKALEMNIVMATEQSSR